MLAYAAVDTAGDLDNTRRTLKVVLLVGSIAALEIKDGRAAKRGSLKLVASRCEAHEDVAANAKRLDDLEAERAGLQTELAELRGWVRIHRALADGGAIPSPQPVELVKLRDWPGQAS